MSATRAPKAGSQIGFDVLFQAIYRMFFFITMVVVLVMTIVMQVIEISNDLKWFVILLPHTSRHIGITGILDHNSDLS